MSSPRKPSRCPRPLGALLLAGALLAQACVSPPTTQELLDVGFRSPEQAFRSYQTAMAANHLDLEYRCLSSTFKRENGIDGMSYRLAREELLERFPFVRLLAEGDIESTRPLSPTLHELTVKVTALFVTERVRVWMERQDYYEVWRGDRLAFDDLAAFEDHVFVEAGDPDLLYALVTVPEGEETSDLTELRLGREWRIAGFERIEPEAEASDALDTTTP